AGRFPADGAESRRHGRSRRNSRCAPRRLCARPGRARHVRRYGRTELRQAVAAGHEYVWLEGKIATAMSAQKLQKQMLQDEGFLDLAPLRLEYRMIGPRPDAAPTIVMLHEGLGSVGLWNSL